MRSSTYKMTNQFILLFKENARNISSGKEIAEDALLTLFEELKKKDIDLCNMEPTGLRKVRKACLTSQSRTSKEKLNKVLRRKSHLFHVVFPSV
jgi:hypothetical protein